jgi:dipeptidyl aminopeptidase/acylaminoacyl peptidase
MTSSFGPWTTMLSATAMHAGGAAQLSTFWKRRMTMLVHISQSRPVLTRRAACLLVLASAMACALPTFQVMPVAAEPADAKAADKESPGRIFLTVSVRGVDDKLETTIIAIDPTTGKWQRICDGAGAGRVRVSPNKETLVFSKHKEGVWTRAAREYSEPSRIFDKGYLASWSPDGKEIIANEGELEEGKGWKHEAWRMKADGTDSAKLPIPETDEVDDWSPDGKWIVTVSDRHEPHGSGYQLYVMRPDGTEERRLTQGRGLNVYPRFSPDSRKVVYLHQEKGTNSIWVVNIDGTNARRILQEEDRAGIDGACWSPDGKHLTVARFDWELNEKGEKVRGIDKDYNHRLEIMDADGKNRKELKLDELKPVWMGHPDWR